MVSYEKRSFSLDHILGAFTLNERSDLRVAWAVVAMAALFSAIAIGINFYNQSAGPVVETARLTLLNLVLAFTFPPIGLLILRSQPGHPIGRIFLAIGGMRAVAQISQTYSYAALEVNPTLPLGEAAFWLKEYIFFPAFLFFILLLAIFPNGHALSRRWRWPIWAVAVSILLYTLSMIVEPFTDPMPAGFVPPPVDPFGLGDTLLDLSVGVFFIAFIGAVTSLILRFRRSRGVERQQLKWFVFASGVFALFFFVQSVLSIWPIFDPSIGEKNWFATLLAVIDVLTPLSVALIPLATGAAITRYRLYGIDVIIRRTLIYSALTFTFAVMYLATVLIIQGLFFWFTNQERSDIAIVVSTLVIATVFSPVRAWVQHAIDRRFFRARYDADRALSSFLADMSQEVDLQQIVARTEQVVEETLQPHEVFVWLAAEGRQRTSG